ncbi:MAG TPA: DUF2807 domain-containing protein [Sphingomicrobium sp.]|jgi:hypothetical protein
MLRSTLPLFAFAFAASAPVVAAEPIALPLFKSIELQAGGEVTIVRGPVQRVTLVNGSRQFTNFQVRRDGRLEIATSCHMRCPRNYNLQIQVESPTVPDVAVEAGGTIRVEPGFAPQRHVSAAVNAGGTIDLRALAVVGASAAVNAGGNIYVRARDHLNAAVNAGGDIEYVGNPQVTMAVANGGNVTRSR